MQFLKIILIIVLGTYSTPMIILRILFIIGLWKMLQKSGVKSWWALIPCARNYMLAKCADKEEEGMVLAVTDLFDILASLSAILAIDRLFTGIFTLIASTLYIIAFIYSIRVYFGIIDMYGVQKRWIILWMIFDGIAAMIFGFKSDMNPRMKVPEMRSDSLSVFSGKKAAEMDQGLTINLEDRSVFDFFKKKYLLRDIHMYIRPGRMVLLLGGSGAGKTTFLNAVNGYEKAKAKMTLNGSDIYAEYKKMQYEVGFVPQQDLMRSKDTVFHTLMDTALLRLPLDLTHADLVGRVNEVMDIFGLTPLKNSLVEKLSGGQKKRLSIAMELLSNPSLFILDEPDSGLDGVMARALMQKLRETADQGKIVIVITHTPDRVIDLFDDVIVLAKDSHRTGRLAFYGTIEEARAFFGKERMEEIVMSVNRTEEGGEGKADEYIMKYVEVQHG